MNQHNNVSSKRSLLSLKLPNDIYGALVRNGYETVQDISSLKAEDLSMTLKVPLDIAQDLMTRIQGPPAQMATPPQSASRMIYNASKIPTACTPLDDILEGGLSRGQILEISGPPGSPKERIAVNIMKSFAEMGHEAIFLDCQNMTIPSMLTRLNLDPVAKTHIHYQIAHTLLDFLIFVHHLPNMLSSHPQVSLLVINSISFPFQNSTLSISHRNFHLENLKQALHKACTLHRVTIVVTSQLSTKMVNPDGTWGTFDSGGKGVMLPSLGLSYLPNATSYRIILAPDGMFSGIMKLLSSPKHVAGKRLPSSRGTPYILNNGGCTEAKD